MTLRIDSRSLALHAGVAALAVLLGVLVALGGVMLAIAGVIASVVVIVLSLQSLGWRALPLWIGLSVVAYPFVRYPYGHSQLTFDRVWLGGIAGGMIVAGITGSARAAVPASPASRRLARWLVVWAAALLLRASLTGSSRLYSIGIAVDCGVLPAVVFFAGRRMISGSERWESLLRAFAIAGALLGLVASFERATGFALATYSGGSINTSADVGVRVSGPYASDDALAVALLICLAATILWLQLRPRPRLVLGVSAVLLELAGITFTFFRGAWIAALVVLIIGYGLRPKRYARLAGTVLLVAVAAGVLLLRASDNKGLAQRLNDTQNVSGRAATYREAIQLFTRHPLAGVGIGRFAAEQQAELPISAVAGVQAASFAHNSYLDLMAEGGVLVLFPFLALSGSVVLLVRDVRRAGTATRRDVLIGTMITGATVAWLLMGLEETIVTSSDVCNTFVMLLLGASSRRLDELRAGSPPAVAGA